MSAQPTVLTADTLPAFVANIKARRHMVVWCYYKWSDGERSIDIASTRYNKPGEFSLSARGISYLTRHFWEDWSTDDMTAEGTMKYVHSYLLVDDSRLTDGKGDANV